jgi:polysaccharide export outer membrane protein
MPRELAKTTLPQYTIEPPDILLIDAIRLVPRAPYRISVLDALNVTVVGALPEAPFPPGPFTVAPGGIVDFGPPYGMANVAGLTLEEATLRIRQQLAAVLAEPQVSVTIATLAGSQSIAGEHLVGPDGTVTLGMYGGVYVTGMTLEQAKAAIESHLSQFLDAPIISVSVFAYNSKVYYVITQGGGLGDGVVPLPITGNETVLDAISRINGLTSISSKKIWIARPTPTGPPQKLIVNWHDITANGLAETNYQILPGDRIFVQKDKLVAFDTSVGKLTAPFERMFGFTTLGTGTVSGLRFFHTGAIGGGFGGGGVAP